MKQKNRVDKGKVARGGACKRKFSSAAANYIHQKGLDKGRVLDFGCGYGLDAKTYNWDAYDPYYNDIELTGHFDTIICTNVISAVSLLHQNKILEEIEELLNEKGIAYICVPRNIPVEGKLSGYNRRPQRYVVLKKPFISIYSDQQLEIYKLKKS